MDAKWTYYSQEELYILDELEFVSSISCLLCHLNSQTEHIAFSRMEVVKPLPLCKVGPYSVISNKMVQTQMVMPWTLYIYMMYDYNYCFALIHPLMICSICTKSYPTLDTKSYTVWTIWSDNVVVEKYLLGTFQLSMPSWMHNKIDRCTLCR
jgi:hypothetical protein